MENNEFYSDDQQSEVKTSGIGPQPVVREARPRKNFFLSDFFNRLNASIIDALLFLGGLTVITFAASLFEETKVIFGQQVRTEPGHLLAIKWAAIGLWFFFAIVMRDVWGYSRSVGKRFCNLKVFAVRAPKPRFYHAFLRNLTVLLPVAAVFATYALSEQVQTTPAVMAIRWASLGLLLIEGVMALVGLRRLGDLIAGTKVIFFKENNQKNRYNNNGGYNNYSPRYRGGSNYRNSNRY